MNTDEGLTIARSLPREIACAMIFHQSSLGNEDIVVSKQRWPNSDRDISLNRYRWYGSYIIYV